MDHIPSYEELLSLYIAEQAKNKENEIKIAELETAGIENIKKITELETAGAENIKKITELENSKKENAEKIAELETKLLEQNLLVQEVLKIIEDKDIKLKKQLCDRFGIKSDKKEVVVINEAEETAQIKFKETKKRGRKKGTSDAYSFDKSKVEYKEIIIDSEDRKCTACGHDLVYTDDSVKYKVDIIPSKVILTKYIIKQYKCSYCCEPYISDKINCFDNESFLTPSLAAFIINSKYNYALPLYRQESILKQLGAPLSRTQLSDYTIETAEKLEPLYDLLKKQLLSTDTKVLQADETTLKVIHKKDSNREKCYVWLYASCMYDTPIYIYEYQASREAKHPQNFLKNYSGYLVCDDYSGYEKINNVKLARCWFHAKKKYADLIKVLSDKEKASSKAVYFHNMISEIIHKNNIIEEKLKNPVKIQKERSKVLTPLIDEYFSEVKELYENGADKSSVLGNALKYSINIEADLRRFLEDGHIPMTNNLSERNGIKPFVILRKNSLFSNTENGAEASCVLMTLVQTAKANLLKPDEYIKYVLEKLSSDSDIDFATLLPTSTKLPENLFYQVKAAKAKKS